MQKTIAALALAAGICWTGAAFAETRDLQGRNSQQIENDEIDAQLERENRRNEVIENTLDALAHDPSENGANAIENATRGALDAAGACSTCDAERAAHALADDRRREQIRAEREAERAAVERATREAEQAIANERNHIDRTDRADAAAARADAASARAEAASARAEARADAASARADRRGDP
jgi:hypothetical protein